METIYYDTWLSSDFDSYLLYLDGLLTNTNPEDNKPMNFQEFRENIQA